MNGTFTVTDGAQVTIHTYTAPEEGWMTTSHLIDLPTQPILADTLLRPDSTNEVLTHAKDHCKPISRVYISHGHPDHFAGAGLADAPLYALPAVAAAIDNGGAAILSGALALTGHGRIEPGGLPRIGHYVAAGEERIDGARVRFEPVCNPEGSEQLTIGFPGDGILIAQDLVYNRVHAFLGEQHFDGWLAAISKVSPTPPSCPATGSPATAACTATRAPTSPPHPPSVAEADGPDDLNRRLVTAFPATAAPPCGRCRATSLTPGHR